jgi:Domain of unknown function (DUF4148)
MKSIKLIAYPAIAALSLAAAFSAHADGPITVDVKAPAQIAKTRADVRAEVLQARARGEITNGASSYDPLAFLPGDEQPGVTLMARLHKAGKKAQ